MWTLQQSGSWDLARVAICWERIYAPSCCLVRFCAVVLLPIPWSIFEGYSTARKKKKCSTLCLVPSHAVQSEPPSNVFQPGGASTWGAGLSSVLLIEIELFWRARSFTIIPTEGTLPVHHSAAPLPQARPLQSISAAEVCMLVYACARVLWSKSRDRATHIVPRVQENSSNGSITSPLPLIPVAVRSLALDRYQHRNLGSTKTLTAQHDSHLQDSRTPDQVVVRGIDRNECPLPQLRSLRSP